MPMSRTLSARAHPRLGLREIPLLFFVLLLVIACTGSKPSELDQSPVSLPAECPTRFVSESQQPAHVEGHVLDTSDSSSQPQPAGRCSELRIALEDSLRALRAGEDLEIEVAATTQGVAPYPIATLERISQRDAPSRKLSPYTKVSDRVAAEQLSWEKYRSWVVQCIVRRCERAPKSASKVFALTEGMLGAIAQRCADKERACLSQKLVLHSDGRDTTVLQPQAKNRMNQMSKAMRAIPLHVCGTRQTVSASQSEAWRFESGWKRLFGDQITMVPSCAGDGLTVLAKKGA